MFAENSIEHGDETASPKSWPLRTLTCGYFPFIEWNVLSVGADRYQSGQYPFTHPWTSR
jgi:hypothetical protein